MKAAEFTARVERVFRAHPTGEAAGRRGTGQTWFAERIPVSGQQVRRWVSGENPVPGYAVTILEALEREAGIRSAA